MVFGSIGIDYVTRVEAIPAPGETVVGPSFDLFPGGKGANQALAAARCGASVAMIGAIGDDAAREAALALLKQGGVGLDGVAVLPGARTQSAFIAIDRDGQNAIVVALGASLLARADAMGDIAMQRGDILLTQRELPDSQTALALERARQSGVMTILNAAPGAGFAASLLDHVDILVVNEHEALDVAAALGVAGDDPVVAGKAIAAARPIRVIVTLGPEGAALYGPDGAQMFAPPRVVPIDTTAAGDAFCGALAAALNHGLSLESAILRGNIAGALACTKPGAQPSLPMKADVDEVAIKLTDN